METERRRTETDRRRCAPTMRCEEIMRVANIIDDNGSIGLEHKVENHEIFIQRMQGGMALLGFIGVANIFVLIFAIIKILAKP